MPVLTADSSRTKISSTELSKKEPGTATVPVDVKTYITIHAHIQDGQIILPEGVYLPDGTSLLITLIQDNSYLTTLGDSAQYTDAEMVNMTHGEQIIVGLNDVIAGHTISVETEKELESFLDSLEEE